jgi:hypothetical protein
MEGSSIDEKEEKHFRLRYFPTAKRNASVTDLELLAYTRGKSGKESGAEREIFRFPPPRPASE